MQRSLKEVADAVRGELRGDPDLMIDAPADISDAREGDIVFAEAEKHLAEAQASAASAVITYLGAPDSGKPAILVPNPRYAFAKALELFSPIETREPGVHPGSSVGPGAVVGKTSTVKYNVFIGRDSTVGENTLLGPFVCIGSNVRIGDNCRIYPFVSIYDNVTIGNGVTIHSGTVIGADGFGYTVVDGKHYKIPHIGSVEIGDDVEIGSNVSIDRARTGVTRIGRGTKVDNLVQIAHNVTIGEDSVVIAQVGISGSVVVGDRVVLTGQAGIKDHIEIGSDSIICGRAGVMSDVEPGSFLSGYPACPHKEQMRIFAAEQRLPGLLKQVRDLEKRIEELEGRLPDG